MSDDEDASPRKLLLKKVLPLVLAGIAAVSAWVWTLTTERVELRAESAELRAELGAYKRQAAVCQDITEQATRLIAQVRKDK